jgi:hypothetical protein
MLAASDPACGLRHWSGKTVPIEQLRPARSAAATVVPHPAQQDAQHDASLPLRQVRLVVHDGNALNGSSRASQPPGSGASP